jgi:chemosensory pili system protein ChpA (sensor histidine kinase/response regulator)
LVNQAGEVSITRSRIEVEVTQIKGSLTDLTDNLERLRQQLRDIELQAETQMSSRLEAAKALAQSFDPLEFDRFTRFQELTRMMAESVNDVATVQRTLQRTLETTEDELASQARLTRDLQDDLLRTRMVEFEGLSDRLYRVVRQAAKETGKQVRLDIVGGSIEVDRGVSRPHDRAFEHLLRNSVTHGIESPTLAPAPAGSDRFIVVSLTHEGNEVGVEFRDDGAGLNLQRIREKGIAGGLLEPSQTYSDGELANLISPRASRRPTRSLNWPSRHRHGRGPRRSERDGRTHRDGNRRRAGARASSCAAAHHGGDAGGDASASAKPRWPFLRHWSKSCAAPSDEDRRSLRSGHYTSATCAAVLLARLAAAAAPRSSEAGAHRQVVIIRSAQQRIALHVDEVLGNQEVVVKNLGPQLSRCPAWPA